MPVPHILADIILGAHQVLHLGTELLVETLQVLPGLQGLLQCPGHGQGLGLLLPGLRLGTVSLLSVARRHTLLLRQHLVLTINTEG